MKSKRLPWIFLAVAAVAMAVTAAVTHRPSDIDEIKSNSTEYLRHHSKGGGLGGDFSTCIRARCSAEFFEAFRLRHGFSSITTDTPRFMDWTSCPENWWNPPRDYSNTYLKRQFDERMKRYRDEQTLLAFRNGYIYYDISVW